jgi:hypothetical protein
MLQFCPGVSRRTPGLHITIPDSTAGRSSNISCCCATLNRNTVHWAGCREHVGDTRLLKSLEVWGALLDVGMPFTALTRSLGRLTSLGAPAIRLPNTPWKLNTDVSGQHCTDSKSHPCCPAVHLCDLAPLWLLINGQLQIVGSPKPSPLICQASSCTQVPSTRSGAAVRRSTWQLSPSGSRTQRR